MGIFHGEFTKRRAKTRSAYLTVLLHCGHLEVAGMENLQAIATGRMMVLCHQCGEMREPQGIQVETIEN